MAQRALVVQSDLRHRFTGDDRTQGDLLLLGQDQCRHGFLLTPRLTHHECPASDERRYIVIDGDSGSLSGHGRYAGKRMASPVIPL